METAEVVVIGAGQAGLSAAYHLVRMGFSPYDGVVVLDRNPAPGGAWQHRWDSLTMHDVHGIGNLPGVAVPASAGDERANEFVPRYFAGYESRFDLPVVRPVIVRSVRETADGRFEVSTDRGSWTAEAIVNATGTWNRPFIPWYPGIETFKGRQLHTADYNGAEEFAGRHVLVVGGGASAACSGPTDGLSRSTRSCGPLASGPTSRIWLRFSCESRPAVSAWTALGPSSTRGSTWSGTGPRRARSAATGPASPPPATSETS